MVSFEWTKTFLNILLFFILINSLQLSDFELQMDEYRTKKRMFEHAKKMVSKTSKFVSQ